MVSHGRQASIQYYSGLWHKESGRPIMVNIKTPDPFFVSSKTPEVPVLVLFGIDELYPARFDIVESSY